jgi:hypothetical protein
MTWKEYCAGVSLITRHFGAYQKNDIDSGFQYWRNRYYTEFLQEIDLSFQIGKKPELNKQNNDLKKMPYYAHFEPEQRIISDDYLDKVLKDNDAESLSELIFKQKKERA